MNAGKKHPFLVVLMALLLVLVLGVLSPVQAAPLEYVSDFPPHPILSDLRVRRAMAYCTDKVALAQAGYPLLTDDQAADLVMNSFIPAGSEFYAGDANITIYPYNITQGTALLETAGWTLQPGADFRTNADGDELAITFTTTTAAFRQAWAAVWEQQMAACGIRITRYHEPASWWFGDTTGLARRQFELGGFAWVGQADPGGKTLWACDQIPQPSNGWAGQNYMGWCNLLADSAIKTAVNSIDILARKEAYKVVQAQYTQDVPALPLFNRTETFSTDADLTGFAPTSGEENYTYNTQDWAIPAEDTIILGSVNEPYSLYTLVDSTYTGNLVLYPVNPRSYLSLNYNFTPQLVTQLSTIENGLANNNSVAVDDGDWVVDVLNNVVELAPGVVVKDATGAEVEFTGDPIQMKQLEVTYPFRNDLTWSDGTDLTIVDFELGYQTTCDRANGRYDFYTCDRTLDVTFATDGNNTYTVTYVPGYQDALYFMAPYDFFPAHRIIETPGPYENWALADVPASAWPTLLELTDDPIGVGPYKIVEWIRGDRIVYTANPYAPADMVPATSNLILKFVAPEDAETMLINGELDMLGWDSLGGLTSALVDAETAGIVKNYVIAGATWEHIDMNLNLMQYSIYLPLISQPAPPAPEWRTVSSPTTTTLNGLAFVAANNIWAAGANPMSGQPKNSVLLHWNGSSWQSVASPTTTDILSDIDFLTSTDGWLVGTCRTYHWNGSFWQYYSSPSCNYIKSVEMVASNDVWALSYGSILRWNGSAWSIAYAPAGDPWLNDLDMVSATDGWFISSSGNVYRWNGSAWNLFDNYGSSLSAIDMVSATDGWIVGGNGLILHWNGSTWTQIPSPEATYLTDISMLSSSRGWIVGGYILSWDGTSWKTDTGPVSSMNAVQAVSENEAWAVGWDGVMMHYSSQP